MIDPIQRLRAQNQQGAAGDELHAARVLDEVHRRTGPMAPGNGTHAHRVRTRAIGVAGVGALAAAGLVVAGFTVPGGSGSGTARRAGSVVPPTATSAPSPPARKTPGPTLPATQGVAVGKAVRYVKAVRKAYAQVDLKSLVLVQTHSSGVKYDDARYDTSKVSMDLSRDVTAGDGTGEAFTVLKDSKDDAGPYDLGTQEIHRAIPGAKDGAETYWYTNPHKGVYGKFRVTTKKGDDGLPDDGTIQEQTESTIADVGASLSQLETLISTPGLKPRLSTATVDGHAAKCVDVSAKGYGDELVTAQYAWAANPPIDWKLHTCFDAATGLPLESRVALHYLLDDYPNQPNLSLDTGTFEWLPKDSAKAKKLLAPDVAGLKRVGPQEVYGN